MKKEKKYVFRKFLIFSILTIIITVIYARYIGTTGLTVKEYIIKNERLASNFDGLKIIHFSDLHYGTTIMLPEVERLVNKINSLRPDIIIFTGDFIDINYNISDNGLNKLIEALNKLNPNIASFAVRGNHDQKNSFERFIEETDFRLLNNENELFYYQGETPLVIVGLDDPAPGNINIEAAFTNVFEEYYTIVLAHRPDVFKDLSDYSIDLFLAGHSHGGQIRIPFIGAADRVPGAKLYVEAEYLVDNTSIFISSGLGTSRYPLRLFNPPSINLYRFFAY